MPRLYIETNYLISRCTGRTPRALEIVLAPNTLELAIPAVCVMEAHKAFSGIQSAKRDFKKPFEHEIGDIGRDAGIHAQSFKSNLAAAEAALTAYLAESEQRLFDAIGDTLARARVVESSAAVLSRQAHSYLSDPTDDMIAASVIEDALRRQDDQMAFFSEDADFGQPSLVDAMRAAGIERFNDINACLAWVEKAA